MAYFLSTLIVAASLTAVAMAAAAPEKMKIDIGMRSYDGTMWFCKDGKDREIPAKYFADRYNPNLDFTGLADNERPQTQKCANGTVLNEVLDNGNCWLALMSSDGQRRSYLVSSDGFHSVCSKSERVEPVEDVNGVDYIQQQDYTTKPLTYEQIEKIAKEVNGGKVINNVAENPADRYKGTDFVIDLLLAVVEPETAAKLKESANNWPESIQLLDYHYFKKDGESTFTKRGIPVGTIPSRSSLETMKIHNDERVHVSIALQKQRQKQ